MKTRQETFDTVVIHLMEQGCKSIDPETGGYRYRGSNGTKCAAGILILDDMYRKDLERKSSNARSVWEAIQLPDDQSVMVRELQSIHDGTSVCHWLEKLLGLALSYNLDTTVIQRYQ